MRAERLDRGENAIYLRLSGVIANGTQDELDSSLLEEHEYRGGVLISLRDVVLLTSNGIGMLLRLNRKLLAQGGKLVLADVPVNVRQVLQFMKLEEVLHIADDEQTAQEMLR